MPEPRKYPKELRERSVRLVHEAREQDPSCSLNAAVKEIALRVGVVPDTLRGWCKQADIDAGRRPGTITTDAAESGASPQLGDDRHSVGHLASFALTLTVPRGCVAGAGRRRSR